MNTVVIGATAGLGRVLCEELAQRGHSLYILASDERDLKVTASNLQIRFNTNVITRCTDLRDFDIERFAHDVGDALGCIDNVFLVAGLYNDNDNGPLEDEQARDLMNINFLAPVRIINRLLPEIRGALVGVGSIAEARPRGRSMVYAASKRGLGFYFEALCHRLQDIGPCIQYYRVGFMDTAMTYGKSLPLPAVDPAAVARIMVHRLGKKSGIHYAPWWWGVVVRAYAMIPWPLFRKMKG